jgi:hypothetical protein
MVDVRQSGSGSGAPSVALVGPGAGQLNRFAPDVVHGCMTKRNPALRAKRPNAASRRECRVAVKYTAEELGAIERAAARDGLAVAAWLGEAGLWAADPDTPRHPERADREELADLVRATEVARRAGYLFNQAVAKLHKTGVPSPDLEPAANMVWKAVRRLDDASLAVRRDR